MTSQVIEARKTHFFHADLSLPPDYYSLSQSPDITIENERDYIKQIFSLLGLPIWL